MSNCNLFENAFFVSCDKPDRAPEIEVEIDPWANKEKGWAMRRTPLDRDIGLPIFYKDFVLDSKPDSATVYASALGEFEMYCNGKRIGTAENGETVYDEMKPGHTKFNKRILYYTYDLSDYLSVGKNRIMCVCCGGWYLGKIAFGTYLDMKYIEMIARLDIKCGDSVTTYVTDADWKACYSGQVLYTDIWDGEIIDLRRPAYEIMSKADFEDEVLPVRIRKPDIDITPHIGPAVRIRKQLFATPTGGHTYSEIIEDETDYGHAKLTKLNKITDIILPKGTHLVYDMGQNLVGRPNLKLKGAAGAHVTVIFGEMLNDSGLKSRGNDAAKDVPYTDNYRYAKARFECILGGSGEAEVATPLFTFYGFRYMQIKANADIEVVDCHADVVGSATKETGTLHTSDERLNQLISNIMWGQRGNYLSIPTDCPQRDERLGWTGDTQVFCRTASYNADVRLFFHKWMQDVRDCQKEDGTIPDVIPSLRILGSGATAWGDALVIVPYTIYQMFGDLDIIKENRDAIKRYFDWLASRPGHIGPEPRYLDWLAFDPTVGDYIAMSYYAYDSLLMEEMELALGNTEDAAHYRKLYEDIKADFTAKHIGEDGLPTQKTQTALLLAIAFKLLPENKLRDAVDLLVEKIKENGNKLSTGFVGTPWLCRLLSDYGRSDMAYTLLLQNKCPSWLYSVDQGATTIWERWNSYTLESGFGDVNMNSFNHYAYGAIGEWMYRYMAGIEAAEPGFGSILIRPCPDMRADSEIPSNEKRLTYAEASFDSPVGMITSKWHNDGKNITYDISLPSVPAKLSLPMFGKTSCTVNGESINVDGSRYEANVCGGSYKIIV